MPITASHHQAVAGGHARHAQGDSAAIAANARKGFWARFLAQVDPDSVLPEAERERRAKHALKAHMHALAARSVQARKAATASPPHGTAADLRAMAAELMAGADALDDLEGQGGEHR